jgi:hypothetical protein
MNIRSRPILPVDFDSGTEIAAVGADLRLVGALHADSRNVIGKGSLNSRSFTAVRLRWLQMHQSVEREHRVFDAILHGAHLELDFLFRLCNAASFSPASSARS